MTRVRQSTLFGSNTITTSTGSGIGTVLALGAAAAMITFAFVVGGVVGGAVALAITVLSATLAGCILVHTGVRAYLNVAHYRATGQLPARQPFLILSRPNSTPQLPAAPEHVTWSATRVYPDGRDSQ